MGLDGFVWFVGVVENRNDPAKLGRVQVRCLGYHTEDLIDIPSADLPWAHVMMPVTDPSMQGLGTSPSFLVEGTWIVGFFRDPERQQPVIMGSLPGVPANAADSTKGFNDPNGKYPGTISHSGHTTGESDVSRLARGEDGENHSSLKNRRTNKAVEYKFDEGVGYTEILTATKPDNTVINSKSKAEAYGSFDEPHPRGVETTGTSTGQYPFNHVHESESGHIQEIDDTPGGERLHREHKSGTYEEIVADGTKTVKVVGSNYELIAGSSNVHVKGDINLTVDGNKREFIRKDYILEVEGDFTRKIHGNEKVKIGAGGAGNLEEVIKGNHGFSIEGGVVGAIGSSDKSSNRSSVVTVGGHDVRQIGASLTLTAAGQAAVYSTLKDVILHGLTSARLASSGEVSVIGGTKVNVKAGTTMNIKSEAVGTMTFIGDESVINLSGTSSTITAKNAGGTAIELTGHVHTDTAGLGANTTTVPIA